MKLHELEKQTDENNNNAPTRNQIETQRGNLRHYLCNRCYQVFEMKAQFGAHAVDCQGIATMNTYKHGRLACKLCNKLFKSSDWLKKHLAIKHDIKYECDRCKQSFLSMDFLQQHICAIHSTNSPKCSHCKICQTWFLTETDFIRHSNRHHGRNTGFQCESCFQKFVNKSVYKDYVRPCRSCGLKGSKDIIRIHSEAVDGTKVEAQVKQMFTCNLCKKVFESAKN